MKVVIGLLAEDDIPTAQGILDAAAITVPTGDLKNGAYDEAGNLYQLPEYVISDPENMLLDSNNILKGEDVSKDVTDDEEEIERKREEKGKAVLKIGDIFKIKARLSDRGGPDVVVTLGKDQPVRILVRRIQDEANVSLYKWSVLLRQTNKESRLKNSRLHTWAKSSRRGRRYRHRDGARDMWSTHWCLASRNGFLWQ